MTSARSTAPRSSTTTRSSARPPSARRSAHRRSGRARSSPRSSPRLRSGSRRTITRTICSESRGDIRVITLGREWPGCRVARLPATPGNSVTRPPPVPSPHPHMQAGTQLGPYRVESLIGAGGMGDVYLATDTRLDRNVAIKILSKDLSGNASLRERFEREAKTISSLNHPNICALYDLGQHEGSDFLVMEYLQGDTLADRIQRGALPPDQVTRIGGEIANALDRAHKGGIVHRDLKPGNIMLTKSGVKLLDFGLAKLLVSSGTGAVTMATSLATKQKPLTQEGTILGTFQHMSPEQLEGKDADARSDIFALGAILYERAPGRRAFEGSSRASLIASILDREPTPMSAIQPLTPPSLERVVRACLAKDPDERVQTAHDVALDLRWIGESSSISEPMAQRRRKKALPWIVAGGVAVAGGAGSAVFLRERDGAGGP